MNTPFFLTRAARMFLDARAKEKEIELINKLRFSDLPKVGETRGRHKVSLLSKLAEVKREKETSLSPAERVKLAAAHLYNVVGVAKQTGYQIKTASGEDEINHDLIKKVAHKYVSNHYDSVEKKEE